MAALPQELANTVAYNGYRGFWLNGGGFQAIAWEDGRMLSRPVRIAAGAAVGGTLGAVAVHALGGGNRATIAGAVVGGAIGALVGNHSNSGNSREDVIVVPQPNEVTTQPGYRQGGGVVSINMGISNAAHGEKCKVPSDVKIINGESDLLAIKGIPAEALKSRKIANSDGVIVLNGDGWVCVPYPVNVEYQGYLYRALNSNKGTMTSVAFKDLNIKVIHGAGWTGFVVTVMPITGEKE